MIVEILQASKPDQVEIRQISVEIYLNVSQDNHESWYYTQENYDVNINDVKMIS